MAINQCKGVTAKGKRCTRKLKNNEYCHNHEKQMNNTKTVTNCFICIKTEECNICYEDVDEQLILPCKHKLCLTCINKMNSFECPFCRNNFKTALNKIQTKIINNNLNKIKEENIQSDREMAIRILNMDASQTIRNWFTTIQTQTNTNRLVQP